MGGIPIMRYVSFAIALVLAIGLVQGDGQAMYRKQSQNKLT